MLSSLPRLSLLLACLPAAALFGACSDERTPEPELPPAGLAGGALGDAVQPTYTGLMALPPDEKILSVGELTFTRADLERSMIHTAARVGLPPGQLEPAVVDALEMPAFKQLLKRGLLFAEAKQRGLAVGDDVVNAERDRLIARLPEGRTLADVFQSMRSDEATFARDLRIDLSVGKLMESVYAELPKVDEKKARALYQQDKERWGSDDRVSVSHILVAVGADALPTAVAQAQQRAEALREKVAGKDKETFAKVAREESDDPSAAQNGGDLGWFSRREMLPGFAEAASALKKGEVSGVVRSDRGFHVLLGQGRKKQTVPFDDVKQRIIATELIAQRGEAEQKLLAHLEETLTIELHHVPRGVPAGGAPTATGAEPDMAAAAHGAHAPAGAQAPPGAAGAPAAPGALPPPGAPSGLPDHMAIPLPSRDNVLPGAQNPHGGDLRLGADGAPDMQLRLKLGETPAPAPAPPTP